MTPKLPHTGDTRVPHLAGSRPMLHLGERHELDLPRLSIRQRSRKDSSMLTLQGMQKLQEI